MKKEKFLWDIIGSVLLLFYGSILLLANLFDIKETELLISIFFALYGSIHLLESIKFWKEKEYSHLFLGILGATLFWIFYFFNIWSSTKTLAFFLLAFALLGSMIKILKADYFHDRKSIFWRVEIASILLFLLSTVLVCLNLAHENTVLLIVMGFYAFLVGIFEFFEAIILNLMKGKLK